MADNLPERPRVLLVAPNVSRMMGGESIKALHVLEGYHDMGFEVTQVAHARVRDEMSKYRTDLDIVYVEDTPLQVRLHKAGFSWALDAVQSWLLHRKAQEMVDQRKPWLVHFTSPISPSVPYFPIKGAPVLIGPLNGNLLHPPALSHRESKAKRIGSKLLRWAQLGNRLFFRGKHKAKLLISGGERTVHALEMGGCTRDQMIFVLDSGVAAELRERPRLTHEGVNWRFAFAGRLMRYKACDLVIRALRYAPEAHLDVIGNGYERAALEALAQEQGVADRVHFLGYIPGGTVLFDKLAEYRAFVFPTLAEANGIVIQESMMMGLPVVCTNWGGPRDLLDETTGILIEPDGEEAIVKGVADAMIRLATQPELAERLSQAARERAVERGYDWPSLLRDWIGLYDGVLAEKGSPKRFGPWLERAN